MGKQDQQSPQSPISSLFTRQAPVIPSAQHQQDGIDVLRKLKETTAAALITSRNTMDPRYSHGGGSHQGTVPDKGKGYDQSAIFDGLLPRIETRGQSKGSSKKSSSKKKESKSSYQY